MLNQRNTHISKVGMRTDPVKLATSIQLSLMDGKNVEILAMGKEAVYTASKAVCIAEGFATQNGLELHWRPSFKTMMGDKDGDIRSVMSWFVWLADITV